MGAMVATETMERSEHSPDALRPGRWAALRTGRLLPAVSSLAVVGIALFLSRRSYQVDIDVYLKGGNHALRPDLYSVQFALPYLRFTYPPFSALLFWPMARTLSLMSAQTVWTLVNVVALFGLIAMSLRAARPKMTGSVVVRWALVAMLPAMLLAPVFLTIGLGQVNLIVCLLVLFDLVGPRRIGRFTAPLGVATGMAAAVKLTPLIFLVYLVLTERRRGALTGAVTFLACSAVPFALNPQVSWAYWTRYVFDAKRAGALFGVSNQNIDSALSRLFHAPLPQTLLLPIGVGVGVLGLWLAVRAHRQASSLLGLLVCATTGLLISPITWTHHLVWIVPTLAWLALAEDAPLHGRWWAAGVAVLFWAAPIWWVPTTWRPSPNPPELHWNAWQVVAGNAYFFLLVAFLGLVALHLRRRARPSAAARLAPDPLASRPGPVDGPGRAVALRGGAVPAGGHRIPARHEDRVLVSTPAAPQDTAMTRAPSEPRGIGCPAPSDGAQVETAAPGPDRILASVIGGHGLPSNPPARRSPCT